MHFCPICATVGEFKDFRGRPAEQCTKCFSLERQRGLYLFLSIKGFLKDVGTGNFRKRVLHFAPERMLFNALSDKGRNSNYRCYDYSPERYTFAKDAISKHDLSDISATKSLPVADIIVHNHVLEHIPGDFAETVKALNSLLVPGGVQVFSIPIRAGKFDEDTSPELTDEDRKARFQQEDHVRIFGSEDVQWMMQTIFRKEDVLFRFNEHLSPELAAAYGIRGTYDKSRVGAAWGASIFYYIKDVDH